MRQWKLYLVLSLVLCLLAGVFTRETIAATTYRTVVVGYLLVPDDYFPVYLSAFENSVINDAGQVAFWGRLGGNVGQDNNDTIWTESADGLKLVVRERDAATGAGTSAKFGNFYATHMPYFPMIDGAGQAVFYSTTIQGTGDGIWIDKDGVLEQMASGGGFIPIPGLQGHYRFRGIASDSVVLNDNAQVAFHASFFSNYPDVSGYGVWTVKDGVMSTVAMTGRTVKGLPSGVQFQSVSNPVLNSAGQMAFTALVGPLDGSFQLPVILRGSDSYQNLIVKAGQHAPGTPDDTVFSGFHPPSINSGGDIAFLAGVEGGDIPSLFGRSGIWSTAGGLHLIARGGDEAPDTEPGTVFYDGSSYYGFGQPRIGGNGTTVFKAHLRRPGFDPRLDTFEDIGLFVEDGNELRLLARHGEPAPGTEPGVLFKFPKILWVYREDPQFVINDVGQVAFFAFLQGGIGSSDYGIWATDPGGRLRLIVRLGDIIDVNDDPLIEDWRTVSGMDLVTGSGGDDGLASSFNRWGELVYSLKFTDGSSGIFVATVPEPATVGGLGVGLAGLFQRRLLAS
ncbi:MAG: PEP-CTERM sorting domain-containing protein [Phycisphaerales bacterium]